MVVTPIIMYGAIVSVSGLLMDMWVQIKNLLIMMLSWMICSKAYTPHEIVRAELVAKALFQIVDFIDWMWIIPSQRIIHKSEGNGDNEIGRRIMALLSDEVVQSQWPQHQELATLLIYKVSYYNNQLANFSQDAFLLWIYRGHNAYKAIGQLEISSHQQEIQAR